MTTLEEYAAQALQESRVASMKEVADFFIKTFGKEPQIWPIHWIDGEATAYHCTVDGLAFHASVSYNGYGEKECGFELIVTPRGVISPRPVRSLADLGRILKEVGK